MPNATAPTTTTPFITTSTRKTSTSVFVPASPYDCNFDYGFCTWTNDPSADFKWKITNESLKLYFGPSADHTWQNKTGSYAYMDVN